MDDHVAYQNTLAGGSTMLTQGMPEQARRQLSDELSPYAIGELCVRYLCIGMVAFDLDELELIYHDVKRPDSALCAIAF